jgi:HEAT repeat protein
MDGASEGTKTTIDPEGILRSALEKIVFFECRVAQLESELAAARVTAERARGDAGEAGRREVELSQALAAERGARAEAERRAGDLGERVRLLEAERERLLGGLVERARLGGGAGADGAPGPEEGGADLAGFIAELRAEIEVLRAWKAAHEGSAAPAQGAPHAGALALGPAPAATPAPRGRAQAETLADLAARFSADRRVGLSGRDTDQLKALLATRADRTLYERSMDDLSAEDAGRRLRAVRALEALGSKAAAPLLAAALGREPEAEVKAALLSALARFGEPFAAGLAERELSDARPAVRVAALEALAAVAGSSAEPRLAGALGDPSPIVRRRAAILLGFTPGARAEDALAAALSDPDRGVARAAAAALSGRPSARAQGALARGLEHGDPSVRRAAAAALGRIAGEAVDVEATPSARRAASRRIAERLAAMGGEEIRSAVLAAAPDASRAEVAIAEPAEVAVGRRGARRTVAVAAPASPARTATATRTATTTATTTTTATATATATRTAVEVEVEAAPPAPAPSPAASPLDASVLLEVRASLRGCTAEDLAAVLDAPAPDVAAALAALDARGALVKRGARWFMR